MIRIVYVWLLGAAVLTAQERPAGTLTALQQAAEKKAADSDALAKGLEARIAHMLPCDPRVRSAIEEVTRASEARVMALRDYLMALTAVAKDDSDAVKRLIAERDALAAEMAGDGAEAQQQRDGIEGQLLELMESVKRRAALADAQNTLAEIAAAARQRATDAHEQIRRVDDLGGILNNLNAAYQARQTALQKEVTALYAENARWIEYYETRVARAQTECSIVDAHNGLPPVRSTNQTPANQTPRRAESQKP